MIHKLVRFSSLFLFLFFLFVPGVSYSQNSGFQDDLEYNTFFSAEIDLKSRGRIQLFDLASFEGNSFPLSKQSEDSGDRPVVSPPEGTKYFFWVRRGGESGVLIYPLSFRKINKIEFAGPYGGAGPEDVQQVEIDIDGNKRVASIVDNGNGFTGWFGLPGAQVPRFSKVFITLVDGKRQVAWIKTDGYLGGIDEESGTYAVMWLAQDGIQAITFDHDGRYARCPEDGAIFYAEDYNVCPFDGTELVVAEPQVGE